MSFQPDYRQFVDVMKNKRPSRLPLYEHIVSASVMERILDVRYAGLENGDARDQAEYFRHHCRLFREMTYDTVSYEVCINVTLPGHLATRGGQGPIQSRSDFDAYPWQELPARYWQVAQPRLDALVAALPPVIDFPLCFWIEMIIRLYVPPRWAHRSVCTSRLEDLVTFFAYPANAGHDYGTIERQGFRKLVFDGVNDPEIVDNPRCQ